MAAPIRIWNSYGASNFVKFLKQELVKPITWPFVASGTAFCLLVWSMDVGEEAKKKSLFLNREAIVRERKHHEQVYADQKRLGELLHLRQQTLEAPKPPAAH